MGQYHLIVNLNKREYIDPITLGGGMKAIEQLLNPSTTPAAMFMLMVCPTPRGGGDLRRSDVAGRWHGDKVVIVGDYAQDGDFTAGNGVEAGGNESKLFGHAYSEFTDISDEVIEGLIGEGVREVITLI